MIKLFLLVSLLTLSACSRPMSNDEIISEYKKCREAGLEAESFTTLMSMKTGMVQCRTKDNNK